MLSRVDPNSGVYRGGHFPRLIWFDTPEGEIYQERNVHDDFRQRRPVNNRVFFTGGQNEGVRLLSSHPYSRHMRHTLSSAYSYKESFEDSLCNCWQKKGRDVDCFCGENETTFDWVWDEEKKSAAVQLQNNNRDVRFHIEFSGGTAVIRGSQPMTCSQHYWEIKMISPVYGTDMMIGVGTEEADMNTKQHLFCSLLGSDSESWGLSYTGLFHHKGKAFSYAPRFGQGTVIGVHLDMWNGTLSFFKNYKPLGIACKGLKGKTLYPMVSSTAARSGMRVIRSQSFNSSLQYMCCVVLRDCIPHDKNVLDVIKLPPGLAEFLANNLSWLLRPSSPSSS